MHFKTTTLAALAAVGSMAQMTSICDKYTIALLKNNTAANQYTLLTLLVNTAVIGNYTGPGTKNPKLPGSMNNVPGILAPGMVGGEQVNLLPYFNGKLVSSPSDDSATSAAAINWLDGGGADVIIANATSAGNAGSNQNRLLTHLYQYFGAALGCSMYGKSGFPSYMGETSMGKVHQYMDLDAAQVNYFIEQVGLAATSFGASMSDVDTVAKLLNTTFNYKCAAPAAVLPSASKEIQAICQASSCPTATSADCGAYIKETMPASASGAMNGSMSATSMMSGSATMTGAAMSGSMSGSMASGSMASGSMASSSAAAAKTSGAANVNNVNGALLAIAGIAGAAVL